MSNASVRIPPDSTGKRIATVSRQIVYYDGLVSAQFQVYDVIVGQGSGASGVVTGVTIMTPTTGVLYVDMTGLASFSDNENIQISAVNRAVVNGSPEQVETQRTVISDPNNPDNMQRVDRFGATVNTFTEGAPQFGIEGSMLVGQQQIVKEYNFAYTGMSSKFWTQQVAGGTVTYDADAGNVVLSTPSGSGAKASITSHFYHPSRVGVGQMTEINLATSDIGKTNLVREWGYFDDNNGAFFRLTGTELQVVRRSDVTGSVVDTPVASNLFSEDSLDGTGLVNFDIDMSKVQVFWVELSALSGRMRFGAREDGGTRVTAHEFHCVNVESVLPCIRTATLPFRAQQYNTGAVGSTSEMRVKSAVVKHAAQAPIQGDAIFSAGNGVNLKVIDETDGEVPLLAGRPKLLLNGRPNHAIAKVRSLSYINDSTAVSVLFRIRETLSSALIGSAFADHNAESCMQVDTSSTAVIAGTERSSQYVSKGTTLPLPVESRDSTHEYELYLAADETTQPVMVWTAQVIGTGSASVGVVANWEEIVT